jgi:hypothetical protein
MLDIILEIGFWGTIAFWGILALAMLGAAGKDLE